MFKFFTQRKDKAAENNTSEYSMMKYKLANDALGIALWDMNVVVDDPVSPRNQVTWSQELRALLGFTDESDFPNTITALADRFHPDDRDMAFAAFANHFNDHSGKTPYNLEYRLQHKSGEHRWFHGFGTTLRDSEGIPFRVAGAVMDINERKQTQNQLMIMSSIVHNSPNFTSYIKFGGECLYVNPAATRISGFTQDELQKDYLGSLFDADTRKYLSEKMASDLRENGISNYEANWRTKDGESRVFAGTSFMVEKDSFASIALDVTEMKRVEAERTEALNTMKKVLDGLDAIIYVTEPKTGEILFMNNSMRQHYGIDSDVTGQICYKILQKDMDKKCDFCPCFKLDKEPDSIIVWEHVDSFTERIHRKTDRYIQWPDGNTVHLQHAIDITDLIQTHEHNKQMTEELKIALLEARDANLAKDEFLSRMSHEMLTPMNAITGMTQIMKMLGIPDSSKEAHGEIEKASRHMLKLINDLLDITEGKGGTFKLVESEFSFPDMFRSVIEDIRPAVEAKQQSLVFDLDHMIPESLVGDEKRLSQVISHLLANANKFTPAQGSITCTARMLGEKSGYTTLQVTVTDNGIGISKEEQQKVFSIFEQVDGGLSRKEGGTGLGLSLAEHIVELMDGEIWVESEIGKGSTFTFTCNLKNT